MLLFFVLATQLNAQNIETYRQNYLLATEDKGICDSMIKELSDHQDQPILVAYLGAYQSIWANHVLNPISKLSTFRKGKLNIETAILKDAKNIEIRFLRYSIQKKAPKFLNYYKDLKTDRLYILNNKKMVVENSLKELIKHVN